MSTKVDIIEENRLTGGTKGISAKITPSGGSAATFPKGDGFYGSTMGRVPTRLDCDI